MTDVDSNKLEHVALNDEGAIVTPDLVKKIQKEKANNNFMVRKELGFFTFYNNRIALFKYVSTAMNFFLSWLMGSTMSMSAQAREFFQQANTTTLPQPMSNEDSEYFREYFDWKLIHDEKDGSCENVFKVFLSIVLLQ